MYYNGFMRTAQDRDTFGVLDILLSTNKIDKTAFDAAKQAFVSSGTNVLTYLLDKKLIKDDDVFRAKAQYHNIEFVSLREKAASPVALGYLEKSVAQRLSVIPFDYTASGKILHLAMSNPIDLATIEFLEKKLSVHIKPYASTLEDIQNGLDTLYEQSLSGEVTAALKEAGGVNQPEIKTIDIRHMGDFIKEAPIAKIVTTILEFAAKSRASDVHIEPLEERTRVRYRIDGILHEKLILPKKIHDSLVSRIKILSDLKIDEKRVPQDGRFNFSIDDEQVDLRVSTLPTVHGEKVVMRLLKKTSEVPTLQQLGLRGRALKNLEEAILRPHGIILVTGPTGSGKTTTLYSVISRINSPKVNIVTLEDPIEYQMVGVNQVQVNPQAGLTFASGLRSFLRQDPNIIMVGEIRDEETAELAIQASLTGHLVFSTLHTSSAAGALPRMLDMKAEPYLLASTITAIVAQRVGRQICKYCKENYSPTKETVDDLKQVLGKLWIPVTDNFELQKGSGCPQCGNTGYLGRIGIFEVLPVTEKIGRLILEHSPDSEIEKQAVLEGMITMKQDGYLKAIEGITTLEEVIRVAQE